jgi:hypothetical protein
MTCREAEISLYIDSASQMRISLVSGYDCAGENLLYHTNLYEKKYVDNTKIVRNTAPTT